MLSIVTALMAEAKPLIEHFSLKKEETTCHLVYKNYDEQIELIVTGSKMPRVAAGVGAIAKRGNKWLNIGICGHQSKSIGSIFMASKILFDRFIDYPTFLFPPPCPLHPVETVLIPELTYPQDHLYEMEAHAFYQAALNFSTPEMIHVVKVVSDNLATPSHLLKPKDVTKLIADHLATLEWIIQKMRALPSIEDQKNLSNFYQRWHFTQTQKHQLEKAILGKDVSQSFEQVKEFSSSKQVIEALNQKVRLRLD